MHILPEYVRVDRTVTLRILIVPSNVRVKSTRQGYTRCTCILQVLQRYKDYCKGVDRIATAKEPRIYVQSNLPGYGKDTHYIIMHR